MPDPRLLPTTISRLANLDYDAVFTADACFVFALRLQERFDYALRGVRSPANPKYWGHVWAKHGGYGIDFRGAYSEEILAALATKDSGVQIVDLSAAEVKEEIAKKDYPEEVLGTLRGLADCIFDSHERFAVVRPPKPEVATLFACEKKG